MDEPQSTPAPQRLRLPAPGGSPSTRETATEADLPALREIAERAGVAYEPRPGALVSMTISSGPAGWLTGVLDGRYSGPGAPYPPPHGYIQAVVIAPRFRGLGRARALVNRFMADARNAGVRWVFAAPDEGPGVQDRVAWLSACGFTAVEDPDEEWPVMGRQVDLE